MTLVDDFSMSWGWLETGDVSDECGPGVLKGQESRLGAWIVEEKLEDIHFKLIIGF